MINKELIGEADTLSFAKHIAGCVEDGTVIYLHGQLGAGKTTFARGFLRGFGYAGKVKSPTYTLVEPYDIDGRKIYHFDLYRLQDANELEHMGVRDYFSPEAICLIEWPEKGFPLLPHPDLVCTFSFKGAGREIGLAAQSERGEKLLTLLLKS